MKHIGTVLIYVIIAVNLLFTGLLIFTAYSPWIVDPKTHPILSCIGLIFPIFLLIHFIFIFFWLFVRTRFALISLISILVCFGQFRTYMPINLGENKRPNNSIKILSYNVMGFNKVQKHTASKPNAILEYIKDKNPDIVCLQEYQYTTDKNHLREKDIKNVLAKYPYYNKYNISTKEGVNGLACFSKFPILSSKGVHYKSAYNGSVIYEILVNNDTITVINNHLESNKLTKEDKDVYEDMIKDPGAHKVTKGVKHLVRKLAEASAIRAVQADTIASIIKKIKHRSILVCGDFNDTPISYTHRVISENLDDAYIKSGNGLGISYNQNKFFFRIDHILISKNMEAHHCLVDKKIKDSDHYPIWCYINLKK